MNTLICHCPVCKEPTKVQITNDPNLVVCCYICRADYLMPWIPLGHFTEYQAMKIEIICRDHMK